MPAGVQHAATDSWKHFLINLTQWFQSFIATQCSIYSKMWPLEHIPLEN